MNPNYEFIKSNPRDLLDKFPASAFEVFDIFLTPSFMNIHSKSFPIHSFACLEKSSKKLIGLGHFAEVESGYFRSPGRGSYGGLQFSKEMEIVDFISFAQFTMNQLQQSGAKKIDITLAPECYLSSHVSEWMNAWFQLGFKVDRLDLNYAIPIDRADYHEKVVHAVRKRINKCRRENFSVLELEISHLPEVFDIIRQNRESRGFPVTMTLEQLLETSNAIPGKIKLFAVKTSDGKKVASSIVYQINPKTYYVFYWGDLPGYADYSCVTFLAEHLYSSSLENNASVLDLGISTVNSIPNPGLVKFKVNLGATASSKFVISKVVSPS